MKKLVNNVNDVHQNGAINVNNANNQQLANNADIVLEVDRLSKQIGKRKIVDRLSFHIKKGQIVGLLGPNGAGKTTTMRMIVGLIGMTEGDVRIQGYSVRNSFSKAISYVGGIIENPEFYSYMSGYDNLKQYQRMGKGLTESRIKEVLSLMGLQEAMHKKVKTYSLGMRQRLGIAQALLHKPSILILDEPTNGLDPAGIREMRDYLKKAAKEEGLAVLVSSHLLSEIELMCNEVVVIQQGKLVTVKQLGEAAQERDNVKLSLRVDQLVNTKTLIDCAQNMQVLAVDPEHGELTIQTEDAEIPKLVNLLAAQGIGVYRIQENRETLEDEFLKWTGGEMHV
jgi:ABC-2 type transport system ATP-binding protein